MEGQSDDSLSGAIIGGIIAGAIVGVAVLILIIVLLLVYTMWFREHSKHTEGVHTNFLLFAIIAISVATRSHYFVDPDNVLTH